MGTRLLFYLILYPLSILPLRLLYGISELLYFILTYLIKYRRKVTLENLTLSFPERSEEEIFKLYKKYNRHLAYIAAEMLKMLTISKKQLKKRYRCENPELVNQFYDAGESVILLSAHYNNWEWMIVELDSMFKHHGVGVGKANTNKTFELLINRARTRNGTEVVFADHVRELFEKNYENHTPAAYMMLSDQSPNNLKKSYITTFLHQESCMIFGGEYFARKFNFPVLYYEVIQTKRGFYTIRLQLITSAPNTLESGAITEQYVRCLEQTIEREPEFWLWSHRRWKNRKNYIKEK